MNGTISVATFDALGTFVRVEATADVAVAEAEVGNVVAAIDAACSRFRDDSELVTVNRAAGRRMPISPLFAAAVRVALDAAQRTAGVVDPTVGKAVRAIGYDVSFDEMPSRRPPVVEIVTTAGWRCIELDDTGWIRVPAGVLLDVGATAKAFAADLAAERAAIRTGSGVLVSIGGDIAVHGAPPPGGWIVGIADSCHAAFADADEVISLWDGGLATSSTTVRRWPTDRDEQHHIVDPATGRSAASGWRTVTAAAASCVESNTFATCGVIAGPDVVARSGWPFRAVADDGGIVRGNGWPAPT